MKKWRKEKDEKKKWNIKGKKIKKIGKERKYEEGKLEKWKEKMK